MDLASAGPLEVKFIITLRRSTPVIEYRRFELGPPGESKLPHEAPRRARGRIAGTVTIALEAPPASLVHDEAASSCAVVCGFAV